MLGETEKTGAYLLCSNTLFVCKWNAMFTTKKKHNPTTLERGNRSLTLHIHGCAALCTMPIRKRPVYLSSLWCEFLCLFCYVL